MVFVYWQNFTVFGGILLGAVAEKISMVMDFALPDGAVA
jgi:acetyl-CoA carboxylase carboxyltransferase component